jgi:hypothetical protein
MRTVFPRLPVVVVIAVMASGLGGCGTVNGLLATGLEEIIPAWAGGLPADAPPRPGTLKYDQWMQERERQRLEAATKKDDAASSAASSFGPVH